MEKKSAYESIQIEDSTERGRELDNLRPATESALTVAYIRAWTSKVVIKKSLIWVKLFCFITKI